MKKVLKLSLTLALSLSLFACKRKHNTDKTKTGSDTSQKSSTDDNPVVNKQYERNGNTIYFGMYPQKLETDASKKASLEEKITAFDGPANATSKGWIKQIDYASNSTREAYYYRAIHIYKYKNYNTSQPYEASSIWYHQDPTTYQEGNTYFFKYEKIKWDILEESDGKAYLYANLALDAYYFEKCTDNKEVEYSHGGKYGYANNYELSSIRKWLNEDFYNLSFNDLQKQIIIQTEVKNGSSSVTDTTNDFVCSNTYDYVTLLSEKEAVTYFPTDASRIYTKSILTDYAIIQDADYTQVLLRSPAKNYAYNIKFINNQMENGDISYASANYALYAIRPVIVITL